MARTRKTDRRAEIVAAYNAKFDRPDDHRRLKSDEWQLIRLRKTISFRKQGVILLAGTEVIAALTGFPDDHYVVIYHPDLMMLSSVGNHPTKYIDSVATLPRWSPHGA